MSTVIQIVVSVFVSLPVLAATAFALVHPDPARRRDAHQVLRTLIGRRR